MDFTVFSSTFHFAFVFGVFLNRIEGTVKTPLLSSSSPIGYIWGEWVGRDTEAVSLSLLIWAMT